MAFCLDFHAAYRCRHAGACCTQDWHIPLEARVVQLVGALGMTGAAPGLAPGTALPRHGSGACVFFDADGGRLCRIHTTAGLDALPSACRHFPRVVLHDDRGVFISLSHFCPTAAKMLLEGTAEALRYGDAVSRAEPAPEDGVTGRAQALREPAGIRIVEAPHPLDIGRLEGFDARGALPPLLWPGVLTDLAGYEAWERAAIGTFDRPDLRPEGALATVEAATTIVRGWRPGSTPLSRAVGEAFDAAAVRVANPAEAADQRSRTAALTPTDGSRFSRYGDDGDSVWDEGRTALARFGPAVNRYLAARLFATPLAYEAHGLLTIVEWLRTCLAVLEREAARGHETGNDRFIEAVRRADLVLVHQTDTRAFCRHAARTIEGARP